MWGEQEEQYSGKEPILWADQARKVETSTERIHSALGEEGESFSSRLSKDRSCFADIVFAVLFVLMLAGMGVVSGIAFSRGDPSLLEPTNDWRTNTFRAEAQDWFQNAVAQMKEDSGIIGAALGFSILLALLWVQLLRVFTRVLVYVTMIGGVAALIGASTYILVIGIQQKSISMETGGAAGLLLALILILIGVFLRRRIDMTCAMLTECCTGVTESPALFLTGTLVALLFAGFVVYWVASFIFLFSIPEDSITVSNSAAGVQFDEPIRNLMFFMVFAFLWTTAFISAAFQMTIAGAISQWYFGRREYQDRVVGSSAFVSLGRAFTTSLGSLAFGSLVLALVRFINFLVEQTRRAQQQNRVLYYLLAVFSCFLGCLSGIIAFINKFAYVYIGMHGYGFCKSARDVCELLSRNMLTAVVMEFIGDYVLFVGKILGASGVTLATLATLNGMGRMVSPVTLAVVGVSSFVIFHLFGSIMGSGLDTVFICYAEDMELHGENVTISRELHQSLQEKARAKARDIEMA